MDIQTPNSAPASPVNKQVMIGVVVGLVVIIGGIVLWSGGKPENEPAPAPVVQQPSVPKTPEEQAKRQEIVLEASRDAIGLGEKDKCAKLLTADEQDTCRAYVVTAEAQQKGDAKICDAITAEYWRINCKDQVTTYRAISFGDISLCLGVIVKERIDMCRRALRQ